MKALITNFVYICPSSLLVQPLAFAQQAELRGSVIVTEDSLKADGQTLRLCYTKVTETPYGATTDSMGEYDIPRYLPREITRMKVFAFDVILYVRTRLAIQQW